MTDGLTTSARHTSATTHCENGLDERGDRVIRGRCEDEHGEREACKEPCGAARARLSEARSRGVMASVPRVNPDARFAPITTATRQDITEYYTSQDRRTEKERAVDQVIKIRFLQLRWS